MLSTSACCGRLVDALAVYCTLVRNEDLWPALGQPRLQREQLRRQLVAEKEPGLTLLNRRPSVARQSDICIS
jgi:hypothetical protein